MTEQMIPVGRSSSAEGGDVVLCVETFGSAGDPAVVLIAGAASSMDWWEDDFCARIAAGGRFVIRYDHRDTGRSDSSRPGEPSYPGSALTTDIVDLLDQLGIERGHLAGTSMGGTIAQELALDHPARVASLSLLSTSSGGPGLPPSAEHIQALFAAPPPPPDWSDREAVIAYMLEALKAFEGSIPTDEARARAIVGRAYDRTPDFATSQNHWLLGGEDEGPPIHSRLGSIGCPTVVLHGTEDPVLPYAHGEALAAAIPAARLIPLEGVGHEFPPPEVWDVVVPAILEVSAARL